MTYAGQGVGSGTVTSVDITAGTGLTASGGPVTTTGSISVDLVPGDINTADLNNNASFATVLAAFNTSDQTVTSSTTLVDATGLTVSVADATSYRFKIIAFWNAAGVVTGGYKFSISAPSTSACRYWWYAPGTLNGIDAAGNGGTQLTAFSTNMSGTVGSNYTTTLQVEGTFTTSASGTFKLQLAQNSSDSDALTLYAGSFIEVVKIS